MTVPVDLQLPLAHVSPVVHTVPSSQPLLLLTANIAHLPVLVSQVFTEHTLSPPAGQLTAVPGLVLHANVAVDLSHIGVPLHRLPSSGQSVSLWQLHCDAPLTHLPAAQTSPVVHTLPSSHAAVLLVWTQPLPASQLSVVQPLLSSHRTAALTALPFRPPHPRDEGRREDKQGRESERESGSDFEF